MSARELLPAAHELAPIKWSTTHVPARKPCPPGRESFDPRPEGPHHPVRLADGRRDVRSPWTSIVNVMPGARPAQSARTRAGAPSPLSSGTMIWTSVSGPAACAAAAICATADG